MKTKSAGEGVRARLRVKAKPGAHADALVSFATQSVEGGPRAHHARNEADRVLEVAVAARAVEGAANEALLAFVAHCLDVRTSAVSLDRGGTSRYKTLLVEGLTQEDCEARLMRRLGPAPGDDDAPRPASRNET